MRTRAAVSSALSSAAADGCAVIGGGADSGVVVWVVAASLAGVGCEELAVSAIWERC